MRLVQFVTERGERRVAIVSDDGNSLRPLVKPYTVYNLVLEADDLGKKLASLAVERAGDETIDYDQVIAENRLLPPLDHPDPSRMMLSGTGLDHLGSAQARDAMHAKIAGDEAELTDSMRMFKLGVEGGKPSQGVIGVQPEWFYKGDGEWVVAPGHPLELPAYGLDGGEEPELVGLYVISPRSEPLRVGFALGNEFSDHILERKNYLYLAHSKLRRSSFGPELLLGSAPDHVKGVCRILRGGDEIWSRAFLTGEDNMTHSIANIEHHHFKYGCFRRPGDVHCHFFGTATLSFADEITVQAGDVIEISAPEFGRPLSNPVAAASVADTLIRVKDV